MYFFYAFRHKFVSDNNLSGKRGLMFLQQLAGIAIVSFFAPFTPSFFARPILLLLDSSFFT
jgi:hypothetical protein